MRIDGLDFGTITIAGQTYTTDVLIYPDGRVQDRWRRARGHRLEREDLSPLLVAGPKQIVVGTGVHGRMRPAPGLIAALQAEGIHLTALANEAAVRLYNERWKARGPGQHLAACFHLTC